MPDVPNGTTRVGVAPWPQETVDSQGTRRGRRGPRLTGDRLTLVNFLHSTVRLTCEEVLALIGPGHSRGRARWRGVAALRDGTSSGRCAHWLLAVSILLAFSYVVARAIDRHQRRWRAWFRSTRWQAVVDPWLANKGRRDRGPSRW